VKKKPFYKVRVVHDPAQKRYNVEVKVSWFKVWERESSFSYMKEYYMMYCEATAEAAAVDRAKQISSQYIVAEF
jgi:ATP-dependent Clp protease ATP-binding subunit ClpA